MESDEFKHGVLLGDGGYKLETYLMTPFRNPSNDDERKFNRSHITTRNTVERKYGVWKRRFPCLALGLRCKLETALSVIVACAVLHNICVMQKDAEPPQESNILAMIEEITEETNNECERVLTSTGNRNRKAVLKRQTLMSQISQN